MSTTSSHSGALEPPITTIDEEPLPEAELQLEHAKPLVVIQPSNRWSSLNLRELWAYRELLFFLTWRDVKVRYKQTAFGVAWVVLQPLLSTLIFTVVLGVLARVPSDGYPYPVFVFAGLLPWQLFSSAVNVSGNSLVGNAHLITKVYFPRLIIPAAAVAARLVDFAVSAIILIGLFAYFRIPPSLQLLWVPVLVALVTLLSLAVGTWTSALNVKYRDIGVMIPVLLQFLMFASPVVYGTNLVPPHWQWLYQLNPLVGIIEGFRSAVFNKPMNFSALAVSALWTFGLLVYSTFVFRRMEKSFADIV